MTMRAYHRRRARPVGVGGAGRRSRGAAPRPGGAAGGRRFVALLTPVVKAFLTDTGFEVANLGVQVFGGHGYIREHGMEQFVRDARIAQLYEGTNGVQALDLVGRKLPQDMGRLLRRFFHPVSAFLEEAQAKPELASFVGPLAKAFGKLQQATALIARRSLKDPDEAGAAATDYLRLFGWWRWATCGRAWPRSPRRNWRRARERRVSTTTRSRRRPSSSPSCCPRPTRSSRPSRLAPIR